MAVLGQKQSDLIFVYTKVSDFGCYIHGQADPAPTDLGYKKGGGLVRPLIICGRIVAPLLFYHYS